MNVIVELVLFYGGRDGGLYTPAADTYLLLRFYESRRSLGVSAAMATATPKWRQRAV